MIEQIINNINYRLDEENLTAEVIKKSEGYEGDIIIPETVVFNTATYRVKNIGEDTFDGCKSLTNITFQGTIAQWKKIKLRENWKDEVPVTVIHCTDGDVEIY